jgi:starch-binding outer membrane protein, SusD/RagB family
MKKLKISILAIALLAMSSCLKDLDREPFIEVTSAKVYKDALAYKQVLAKIYAGFAVTGQEGPAGNKDIQGIDEGFSNYLRQYYNAQELPTDEAVVGWNDGTIKDLHWMNWGTSNEFITALYYRIFYQISLCNEYIRECTDAKLSERGLTTELGADIKNFRAEARFMRALSYWHALDLYRNVPFVTEEDKVGAFFPLQKKPAELFAYIESELKAIEGDLKAPRSNEYARADQAAAWTVLAKLYLNAKVYTGTDRNTDCIEYCKKIINAGYTLEPNYRQLFMIGNDKSKEVIFPIAFDGLQTQTWGGMTFMVHAPVGGTMNKADFGINGGWAGYRTTKTFVSKFADVTGATDTRAMFHTDGQNLEIDNIATFKEGYAIGKYKNVDINGKAGSDPSGNHIDTDYPMFRLADIYLMYAEAVLRGGTGGDRAAALGYVNALRTRAYKGTAAGNIKDSDLTLDFILDERARELQWECHRRTDLIRFDKFASDKYIWPWKGNVKDGRGIEVYRTIFPIPASEMTANPKLIQNTGY